VIATSQDILDFWFAPETQALWYASNQDFDARIRDRFLDVYGAARQSKLESWREDPQSMLALIIVLDQFSRNMFRNDARAFAADHLARAVVMEGMAKGFDRELQGPKLDFFYMPLMHSESMEDHNILVRLGRGDERYAREHREIIERFGRYPHRNAVLNRQNTAEEAKFLGLK
jgi:uncharacterized protein (DUF924 family)